MIDVMEPKRLLVCDYILLQMGPSAQLNFDAAHIGVESFDPTLRRICTN